MQPIASRAQLRHGTARHCVREWMARQYSSRAANKTNERVRTVLRALFIFCSPSPPFFRTVRCTMIVQFRFVIQSDHIGFSLFRTDTVQSGILNVRPFRNPLGWILLSAVCIITKFTECPDSFTNEFAIFVHQCVLIQSTQQQQAREQRYQQHIGKRQPLRTATDPTTTQHFPHSTVYVEHEREELLTAFCCGWKNNAVNIVYSKRTKRANSDDEFTLDINNCISCITFI